MTQARQLDHASLHALPLFGSRFRLLDGEDRHPQYRRGKQGAQILLGLLAEGEQPLEIHHRSRP